MWVIISIFISSIDEPASIKHVGYPFETVTECEMALSEYLIDPSHKMARDEDGLYVRTDFKQGWVGLKRCVEIWR